jgi:hypothetical protein
MNRIIVYPGAIPLDSDLLSTNKNAMLALGGIANAMLGDPQTSTGLLCAGLALKATSPTANMVVTVGRGTIFSLQEVDPNAYGSLAADTADTAMKVGQNIATTPFTLTAPGTAGQSINYLIEATFLEADGSPVVLNYYNATTPTVPYSGPNNSGAAQNTLRSQTVSLQLKAGTAATTGTQTTPAVDPGWCGLYVITVNYGQTQVTQTNCNNSLLANAPFIPSNLGTSRTRLTANANLYVSTTGNDSNDGLTASTALLTLAQAQQRIMSNMDFAGQYDATINLAAGSYGAGVAFSGQPTGWGPNSVLTLLGNSASPSTVTISLSASSASCVTAVAGATVTVNGLTLVSSGTGGNGLATGRGGTINYENIVFGAAGLAHINISGGGVTNQIGAYTINGNAIEHVLSQGAGQFYGSTATVTLTGTPAFTQFVNAFNAGIVQWLSATFSGGATGARYSVTLNGAINTGDGGADYFPGTSAGSSASGGEYV